MSKSQNSAPVNRTKLYRPPVTEDYISRDVLDAQLNAGIDLPLCIVCAPAGYGKSTLISHWLEVCDTPSAWLSLDESDSDVWIFLNHFVAALRTVSAEACTETLNIINAESLPPLPVIAIQLSNDLDELDERLILVLDDYHRIHERDVHIILDHLLEHPSRNMHLVILSRRDPLLSLAFLRARHMLNEIRMRDLEFSKEETLSLLNRVVEQPLLVSSIEQLHRNMEGWPAGIRLAALALQQQDNVEGFLNQFGAEARQLQEYLIGEVLLGQPRRIREFMLITSVLGRFNASLCEAMWNNITDKNDEISGKDFINTLEDAGLFCVALDGKRDWFRYHHIFGDLLQRQLKGTHSREAIVKLYKRASRWFADNGHYEEAIQHALKADDSEGAAEIVGHARHELMNRDQWHLLERWLKLFSRGAIEQNPQLMVLRCWLDLSHWYRLDALMQDLEKTNALLESASIDAHEADSLKTEVSVIRGSLAYWTSNPELVETLTEPALSGSSVQREYVRSVALMLRAGAYQVAGEAVQAERLQRDHIDDEKCKSPGSQARVLQGLCFAYWREADTRKLMQAATRLLQISLEHELQWSHSFARYFIGLGHYERNELNDAIEQFEIIVEDPYRYPIQNVTHCSFLLSLCYQSQGLPDRARDVAESITSLTFERGNKMFIDLAEAFQAELDLQQGHTSQAGQWAKNYVVSVFYVMHRFFNAELTFARIMMVKNHKAATEQLDSLHEHLSRSHHQRLMIDVLGMKALQADADGEEATAVALLEQAVLLGQTGPLVRPLADLGPELFKLLDRLNMDQEGSRYVKMIFSAQPASVNVSKGSTEHQHIYEVLSRREIQILEHLARNMSNKEIAQQLYISTGTVKRHAHNIYGKLDVSDRRKAVSKATGLGILKTD